jgi:rfaE bifunctional protein kinase chain/domain
MTAAEILAGFRKLRVLAVGDVCLDRWCRYDPSFSEPSRETGIPRIAVVASEVTPGAAGTVANNLMALGAAKVSVLGAVGDDGFGYELERALTSRGFTNLLVRSAEVPTFTYTKLLNASTGEEDLARLDFIYTRPIPDSLDREVASRLQRVAAAYDVILVSDQAETPDGGVVTPRIRETLARIAKANPELVIWVDSRMRAEHFHGVVVKSNQHEAEAASRRVLGRVDYAELRTGMQAPLLIVTHGSEGALVVDHESERWARARAVASPVDICGAGDSFSAAAALTWKITGDPMIAAEMGNRAASITIMKKGTGTASAEEMLACSNTETEPRP